MKSQAKIILKFIYILTILLMLASQLHLVHSTVSSIVVEYADSISNLELNGSEDLDQVTDTASPGIVVEYADSISNLGLNGSEDLTQVTDTASPGIVVEYADSISNLGLNGSEDLTQVADTASPGIVVEYADSISNLGLNGSEIKGESETFSNLNPISFTIFATRIGLVGERTANGHIIQERDHFIALPSPKVLCSNGGHEFEVRITYKERSVVAPIWDVGPWNVKDDYWNPSQQREMWNDLPQGKPEAQAAYQDGYNGGLDQYGRTITNTAGIDLADGTFWDDLGMVDNDWVTVEFLWVPAVSVRDSSPYFIKGSNSGHPEYWNTQIHDATSDGDYNGHTFIWTYVGGVPGSPSQPDCWVEFKPHLSQAGRYDVYAGFYADPQNSHNVSHTIYHEGSSTTVIVDQYAPDYFTWKIVKLGTWDFAAGANSRVMVTDATGESYDGVTTLNVDTLVFILISPPNNPPDQPTLLSQLKSDGLTYIYEGGSTQESTIVFKGTVSDPDGDDVQLEIELRQISEILTEIPTPETISEMVPSGTEVTITRHGLVDADYHWQYRAKDINGETSSWVEFGDPGNIDFTVSSYPPTSTPPSTRSSKTSEPTSITAPSSKTEPTSTTTSAMSPSWTIPILLVTLLTLIPLRKFKRKSE